MYPLVYIDKKSHIECRLAINRVLDGAVSSLLSAYGKYDTRFIVLVYSIKEYFKEYTELTSYAITLMTLHYLQTIRVLPCLQILSLSKPTVEIVNDKDVYYEKKLDKVREYMKKTYSTNNSSVGELFIGFFIYYGFTFDVFVI